MQLHKDGTILMDTKGNHFSGLLPTCFLLFSPNYDWSYKKDYIDRMIACGARGFRMLLNCWWGVEGSHGGNTLWQHGQQVGNGSLMQSTEQVVAYLAEKDCYAFDEVQDSSTRLAIGMLTAYSRKPSLYWTTLYDFLIELNCKYHNIILGLGNETAKGFSNKDMVEDWMYWSADYINAASEGVIPIAVDVSEGTGIPSMGNHPAISIVCRATPRWHDDSNLDAVYDVISETMAKYPDKVYCDQEPNRRNWYNMGDDCDEASHERYRKQQFLHMGALHSPHGLGNGQEECQPEQTGLAKAAKMILDQEKQLINFDFPDDYLAAIDSFQKGIVKRNAGDDCHSFLWGFGEKDYWDLWAGWNKFVEAINAPPAGGNSLRVFNFKPDNSWFSEGKAWGFSTPNREHFVALCRDNITINMEHLPKFQFKVVDLNTGVHEWKEIKDACTFRTVTAQNKLVYCRKAVADPVNV